MDAAPPPQQRLRRGVRKWWIGWLAVVCAGACSAGAHDLWLEPETVPGANKSDDLALHLRLGDQFKTAEERPLQKDHVARFDLFSDRVRRRDLEAAGQEGQAPAARVRREPGALLAVVDRTPRPITMERDRFNRYLEEEGQEAALAWRAQHGQGDQSGREVYTRYLKALVQDRDPAGSIPSTLYKRRVGQRLEILLENDPGRIGTDKRLTVKVLFEGKPLAGAKVFAYRRGAGGGQEPAAALTEITSAQGLAEFKLDQAGLWLVRLVHVRVPAAERKPEPSAPWESFWATYCFTVREAAAIMMPKD